MKKILLLSILVLNIIITAAQPTIFNPRGIGGGGALFFPSVNPGNDNEYYVACDMSEMFHSLDFGRSYSQIPFTKLQVSGVSTYGFTNDPNIAYSIHNDGNNIYPVKTNNGGNLWTKIAAYDLNTYGKIYGLSTNYNNPNQLLINGYGDILFSNNGGTSFSLVKHAANMGAGLIIGGVLWDGTNIYIGTNEGLYYSTNSGGKFDLMSTTGITAGQLIWSFAGAKNGANIRFVCITANSGDVYNGVMPWDYYNFAKAVYVMDNANGTWMPKSTGITFSNDFLMYVGMAWNDINTIYLGGHDVSLSAPLVYKSANGGDSWSKVFKSTNNENITTGWSGYNGDKNWSWGETCFGMSVAPNNSNKILFGDFGYVHTSSDGGTSWKQAYIKPADEHPAGASTPKGKTYHSIGLENTTSWQVFWQDANNIIGCFSDIGGIRSTDAGLSWGYTYNGFSVNSLYRMVKSSNNTIYGACSNIHDMYESTRLADAQLDAADGNGKIVYSTDNGATWLTLHSFGHPVYWLATDPNNANRLFASVIHYGGGGVAQQGGIWMTSDLNKLALSSWVKLSNPPRTEGHPSNIIVLNNGLLLCTFSGRRNSSGVFTASSGVFIYDFTNSSWTDLSDAGMKYWTKDIIIDPNDATQNTWYACVYSGWGGAPNGLGGLYKTINGGNKWTKLTASQFDRVTSITFNPNNFSQAYLTTETQGLWISKNMNTLTPSWTLVDSYPFRQPVRVFFNPYNVDELWVTSFGNGMKVGNTTGTGITNFNNDNSFSVYPNPVSDELTLHTADFKNEKLYVYNALGQLVDSYIIKNETTSISTKHWTKGMYFLQFENRVEKLIKE